jgi:hypothetical protein
MLQYAEKATKQYNKYKLEYLKQEEFVFYIMLLRPEVNHLYLKAGEIPIPPSECRDFSEESQNIFATIDNMYLYVSDDFDQGKEWLFKKAIKEVEEQLQRLEFEKRKFR